MKDKPGTDYGEYKLVLNEYDVMMVEMYTQDSYGRFHQLVCAFHIDNLPFKMRVKLDEEHECYAELW